MEEQYPTTDEEEDSTEDEEDVEEDVPVQPVQARYRASTKNGADWCPKEGAGGA
jgi:hypothetical protein